MRKSKDWINPTIHARLLIPTLVDFFKRHPLINPKTFLGDATFDSVALYKELLTGDSFGANCHFTKAYIPLNSRAKLENPDYRLNADGIPCCPHDETLPMKYEGTSKLKSGVTRYKFVCPKIKWEKTANTSKYKSILESFYPPPNIFCQYFPGMLPA